MRLDEPAYREPVYELVRSIPPGRVMTYGQIAAILGPGYTARSIGYVMRGSGENVPWHRVINARGRTSTSGLTLPLDLQRELLEREGVEFSSGGVCSLKQYGWEPAA